MIRILVITLILLLSACATTTPTPRPEPKNDPPVAVKPAPTATVRPKCMDCGIVKDIRKVNSSPTTAPASSSQKPAVLGGIVGGVISKPSAQAIQAQYEVVVELLSGKQVLVLQKILSTGMRVGSKVRVSQGRILAVSP
jgi:hypothetical protein